jgi:hypothetical protein
VKYLERRVAVEAVGVNPRPKELSTESRDEQKSLFVQDLLVAAKAISTDKAS